jgi:hypothetical protein
MVCVSCKRLKAGNRSEASAIATETTPGALGPCQRQAGLPANRYVNAAMSIVTQQHNVSKAPLSGSNGSMGIMGWFLNVAGRDPARRYANLVHV